MTSEGRLNLESSRTSRFWRGQLFLFDPPVHLQCSPASGWKLLGIVLLLEAGIRPLLRLWGRFHAAPLDLWWPLLFLGTMAALASLLVVWIVRVPLSQLGLRGWSSWTSIEKVYFLEILPLTVIIFCVVAWTGLMRLWTRPDFLKVALLVFAAQMFWGFYQEFLYRGVLQSELVRRFGAPTGIIVGNLIFTFGPLHFYHFGLAAAHPASLWVFAGIFAIGLYFAILYHRSGNLWIIAILHGLGDFFIDGLNQIGHLHH